MPPFFAEIARVLRPGGHAVIAASIGPATPFYTPESVLRRGFERRGMEVVDERRGGRRDLPRRGSVGCRRERAERAYALIVNPSSGAGRGSTLLPEAEEALTARGLEFRTVVTTSLEHGVETATDAHAKGETPVVMSGDGLVGQVGGALAGTGAAMGLIPGGRGNDLARVLGIPSEIDEAADVLAAGNVRQIDVGEVNERALPLHRLDGLRLRREPDRERGEARSGGTSSTPTPPCAPSPRGSPRPSPCASTAPTSTRSPATRSPRPTARRSAAGCSSRPTPTSRTGSSTS